MDGDPGLGGPEVEDGEPSIEQVEEALTSFLDGLELEEEERAAILLEFTSALDRENRVVRADHMADAHDLPEPFDFETKGPDPLAWALNALAAADLPVDEFLAHLESQGLTFGSDIDIEDQHP